ncbi:MAG: hypothetical protein ABIG42_12295, partial [bacterium]
MLSKINPFCKKNSHLSWERGRLGTVEKVSLRNIIRAARVSKRFVDRLNHSLTVVARLINRFFNSPE